MLFFTIIVNAQWVKTNGPYVNEPASSCLASGSFLLADTFRGLLLSSNNGTSWTEVSIKIPSRVIYDVISFAAIGMNLFIGTYGNGIFLSTDNGINWASANNGFTMDSNFGIVTSLVVIGTNLFANITSGRFASVNEGVFLSTNYGASWTAVNKGLTSTNVTSLIASGTNLYSGNEDGSVFLSTDNGTNWTSLNNGSINNNVNYWDVRSLAVIGTNIFAATSHSSYTWDIFLSTNNGTSWKSVKKGLNVDIFLSLTVIGTNLIARTTDYRLILSTNNGANWTVIPNSLSTVNSVAVIGTNLYAGTENGIYFSTDIGSTWTAVKYDYSVGVGAIAVTTNDIGGTNIFAGSSFGIYLSTNNGTNWTAVNTGLPENKDIYQLAVIGTNIFAGTVLGVYLSTDNGTNWNAINNGLPKYIHVLSFAVNGTNIFVGTMPLGGIFLSTNYGTNWTDANKGITYNSDIYSLAINGTNLFAGTSGYGVLLSTNNGISWSKEHVLQNGWVQSLAVCGTNLFAGTRGGVYLSADNGTSWTLVNNNLPLKSVVNSFAVAGTNLFAATDSFGVFLSMNNGANWTAVNTGFPANNFVYSFAIDGTNLLAGTLNGVWMRPLSEMITGVDEKQNKLPKSYSLQQNYPNPFNPKTTINYSVPKSGIVTIKVYDVLGDEITTLLNENKPVGNYSIQFNTGKLTSGIYFYRMEAGDFTQTKKLILLR